MDKWLDENANEWDVEGAMYRVRWANGHVGLYDLVGLNVIIEATVPLHGVCSACEQSSDSIPCEKCGAR